jgi:hypothetical protein
VKHTKQGCSNGINAQCVIFFANMRHSASFSLRGKEIARSYNPGKVVPQQCKMYPEDTPFLANPPSYIRVITRHKIGNKATKQPRQQPTRAVALAACTWPESRCWHPPRWAAVVDAAVWIRPGTRVDYARFKGTRKSAARASQSPVCNMSKRIRYVTSFFCFWI